MPVNDIPFNARHFTLDGEPVDIEDFISANSNDWKEAAGWRSDIAELPVDYDMYFGGGASPERVLHRLY